MPAGTKTLYSYSRLESFKQCPRQYAFKYIERPDVDKLPSIEAYMGTVCHETIQQIYKDLKLSRLMSLEETLAFYDARWQREKPATFRIVRERYNEDNYRLTGREIIKTFYETNAPFKDGRTVGIEKQVELQISDNLFMMGYIDRLVDHGDGHYEIIDYKTSADLPGLPDLEENWQLPIYHMALLQMFPDLREVTCTWYYLAHNKLLSVKKTKDQLQDLQGKIVDLVKKIESTAEFETRVSALCSWCDYESLCPARKHAVMLEKLDSASFSLEDGVRLVDAYIDNEQVIAQAKEKLELLKEQIYRYAQQNNLSMVRGTYQKMTVWKKNDAIQIVSKDENPAAAAKIAEILRRHGLWDRYSYLSNFTLAKAVEAKEIPPAALAELAPYIKKENIWRLYPSNVRNRE